MSGFTSVLVANRGEIALRVMQTARRMGCRVVAVYSDADAGAIHARAADQALCIGGPSPRDSYLNIEAIVAAAKQSGAQAVHPGYGFLAENAVFADAVIAAGLTWIGPPPAAMRAMGDKAAAKRLLGQAGVPCLPGYAGAEQDAKTLASEAERIDYPLMIKATAGGGGRGMRLVHRAADFTAALASAQSEANAAFGNATVMLEKALVAPRHVEIQVFADTHGNVVHMGERDCSVQRRHQKLIEEAPSPAVSPELRRRMGEVAVAAARAAGYVGAGTVECLLGEDGQFHFMEMNTRLQVEHPVTEALTGFDLVEWQIRVARGEALPVTDQAEILRRVETGGHAIEVRLCAEDPAHDFLPQTGKVLMWEVPAGVRIDCALETGAEVPPYYDSMIAKLIAHAPDRTRARGELAEALRTMRLLGVRSNQAFLAAALEHPEFTAGKATTVFIERHGEELLGGMARLPVPIAALVLYSARARALGHDPVRGKLVQRWPVAMRLAVDGAENPASVTALGGGRYSVDIHRMEVATCTESLLVLNGDFGRMELAYRLDGSRLYAARDGIQAVIDDLSLKATASAAGGAQGVVRAPMAGRIVSVAVVPGQKVEKGATLLALEAMKMEHPALAPMAATVKAVHVAVGAQVTAGAPLVELEPAA